MMAGAALLTLSSAVPYVRDVMRGRTIPQRVSWFAFTLLSLTATIAQLRRGADAGAWLTGGSTIAFGIIFVASLRHGVGGFDRPSVMALVVLGAGVTVSLLTSQPIIALAAAMVSDASAISLTVCKTLMQPMSETRSTWLIDGFAGLVSVSAASDLSVEQVIYPVYHVASNAAVLVAMMIGTHRLRRELGIFGLPSSRLVR
jgi:hypothetical protein